MPHEYLSFEVETANFTSPLRLYVDNTHTPTPNPSWTRIKTYGQFRDHLRKLDARFPGSQIKLISIGGTLELHPLLGHLAHSRQWPDELYFHNSGDRPEQEIAAIAYTTANAPAGTLRGYGTNYWGTTHQPVRRTELPPPARDHTA